MAKVVIAGSSGLIGMALRRSLAADRHQVVRLIRREPQAPDEICWQAGEPMDPSVLAGADVVVNLAGAGIGDRRWSAAYKDLLLRSRIDTTATLATLAARTQHPPAVFISASGIRYYGIDRGDETLTESAAPASPGFLPMVTQAWEEATRPAEEAGIRVCHLRTGLVLSASGGVLPQLLPWFRLGLGASFGSGREYWSHISLTDTIRAIRFLTEHPTASGPYNITAPEPARNRDLTAALADELHRPAPLRLPFWTLRSVLGEIAPEVLGSLRVIPARLTEAGFTFHHPTVRTVLHAGLSNDHDGAD
ncbi:TIGR01777 family oxidoreductase [Actinoallomurus sp. NPDC050550]|uniref:TIGR01777 family oxidoreductase n=1 Tax=Actinoallomurus sp. NPDC050550 TaxID=3154937 RepID=UPI0033E2BB27